MSKPRPAPAWGITRGTVATGAAVVLTILCTCRNPFLPQTGAPLENQYLRRTPEGLLRQLEISYNRKRLPLFRDLFFERAFRFYIPQTVVGQLQSIDKSKTEIVSDTTFAFVPGDVYTYLTFKEEMDIHRNLFRNAEDITFVGQLRASAVLYRDTILGFDTVVVDDSLAWDSLCGTTQRCLGLRPEPGSDSLVFPDTLLIGIRDTTEFEMITWESQLQITSRAFLEAGYEKESILFELGPQVFYGRKDPEGLWRIAKWFELGY